MIRYKQRISGPKKRAAKSCPDLGRYNNVQTSGRRNQQALR